MSIPSPVPSNDAGGPIPGLPVASFSHANGLSDKWVLRWYIADTEATDRLSAYIAIVHLRVQSTVPVRLKNGAMTTAKVGEGIALSPLPPWCAQDGGILTYDQFTALTPAVQREALRAHLEAFDRLFKGAPIIGEARVYSAALQSSRPVFERGIRPAIHSPNARDVKPDSVRLGELDGFPTQARANAHESAPTVKESRAIACHCRFPRCCAPKCFCSPLCNCLGGARQEC